MPRIAETTDSLLNDLTSRLERLVAAARKEGRDEALAELRHLVAGGPTAPPVRRGPGRPKGSKNGPKAGGTSKPRRARKDWWATATPEQKAERTRKMLAGRGLKPKGER